MKKKKILIYSDKWINGGIEAFIMNTIRCLDNENYDITIICSQKGSDLYDEELEKRHVELKSILDESIKSPVLRRMKAISKFKKIVEKNKYDIAHFNICNSVDILYSYLAKKNGIKKIIVHSHCSNISGRMKNIKILIHEFLKRILSNVPTDYIACSNEAANWMFTKNKLEKVEILDNSVDVDKYKYDESKRSKTRESLGISDDTYVIGNIGRFSKEKNHEFLIEVFEKVYQYDSNVKLLLVGEGDFINYIKDKVNEKKLEENVIFYGVTQDVQGVLSAMDCFVLPSIFEGKPVVSIEEQISGLQGIYSSSITKEVELTNLIEYIDLDKGKDEWAKKILEKKKYVHLRKSRDKEIEKKGYGLDRLKEVLERIYNS